MRPLTASHCVFANWGLENTMPRRHLEDTLFLHDHRRDWYVFGGWRPKLRGMRRWDGSHCVFRQMGLRKRDVTTTPRILLILTYPPSGPRLGDFTTPPRILPVLTRSPSRLGCFWCVETQAEWDAAVDSLASRISPNWGLENTMS